MEKYSAIYIAVISLLAIVMTVYDKAASKRKMRRISENALMTAGFFGGATAMYATMQLIRHKTKHKKFMLGLPCFIVLHIALLVYLFLFR